MKMKDKSKKEILRDKVITLVKDFLINKGGITACDLESLFGSPSLANNTNEVATGIGQLFISLS
jgi:hypothetical protein